jgi:hypothetical protein
MPGASAGRQRAGSAVGPVHLRNWGRFRASDPRRIGCRTCTRNCRCGPPHFPAAARHRSIRNKVVIPACATPQVTCPNGTPSQGALLSAAPWVAKDSEIASLASHSYEAITYWVARPARFLAACARFAHGPGSPAGPCAGLRAPAIRQPPRVSRIWSTPRGFAPWEPQLLEGTRRTHAGGSQGAAECTTSAPMHVKRSVRD